jgi:hypothetical protein
MVPDTISLPRALERQRAITFRGHQVYVLGRLGNKYGISGPTYERRGISKRGAFAEV